MIKLIIKFVIGVLAIPVAYAATKAFYDNFILINEVAANLRYFVWGIVSYSILHLLFYKPAYLYVLGHEAVHAGVAWLFGGKIKSFKVSEEGGSVGTTKSNFIIELAPYFFPIYTIIITIIYFVVSQSYPINGAIFLFLIGFTLAFHIISTVEIMKVKQPDIVKSGYVFSIAIVYIVNIIVMSMIFGLTFPGFTIGKFFLDLWSQTQYIYVAVIKQLFF
ncbi:MAG: hypothetical protein Q8R38_06765 [Candidatus Omnitrophota bacterium]|nr:hypothetical protein [Candidatus Omnitrophota bacterium]